MALSVDTLLPTPWGWTSVHDLKVGSVLFDELGYPCRVTQVSEPRTEAVLDLKIGWGQVGKPELTSILTTPDQEFYAYTYKHFNNIKRYVGDLIPPDWPTYRKQKVPGRAGRPALAQAQLITVEHANETAVYREKRTKEDNYRQWHTPITFPLHLKAADLRIPPYVMGLMVNQYNTQTGTFRTTRRFLKYYAEAFAQGGYVLVDPSTTTRLDPYTFLDCPVIGIQTHLDDLNFKQGLIPPEYLRGSAQQRMELVAGLLDRHTIHIHNAERNMIRYETTSLDLGLQMTELVRSLGFPATMRVHDTVRNGREFRVGVSWRPAEMPHKHPLYRTRYVHKLNRVGSGIERYVWKMYSAEKTGMSTVRSISVDSPYGLFSVSELFFPLKGDKQDA